MWNVWSTRSDPIRSDNGPHYASAHFTAFCKSWGIEHVTSSPNFAQSNGFAERQVRLVKHVIKKCLRTPESIPQALLEMRATQIDAKLPSPAELLLKRRVATCLPSHTNENRDDGVHDRLEERRAKMTISYNKTARKSALPPLYPGQPIRIIGKPSKTWFRGTVRGKCAEPRSYVVEAAGASMLRRNRYQLREATTVMTAVPVSSSNDNSPDDITTTTSVIAAREGNDEAQKRVNTNGNRESEATEATWEMRSPERVIYFLINAPGMGRFHPLNFGAKG